MLRSAIRGLRGSKGFFEFTVSMDVYPAGNFSDAIPKIETNCPGGSWKQLDPRVADFDVAASPTQFAEADSALDRKSVV